MRGSITCTGWCGPSSPTVGAARLVRNSGPYDLVFGNILARPLRAMARDLARNLAPGGTAILAGLLRAQARDVLAAHRRAGLVLERMIDMRALDDPGASEDADDARGVAFQAARSRPEHQQPRTSTQKGDQP